jgi:hypothetical protein
MSQTPPPPPAGGDPEQPPPTTPYSQQPGAQGWQPGWQESWQPTTSGPTPTAGQPAYGQPPSPQVPYGAPQYPGGYGPVLPDHPQATTVLILGILGVVVCPLTAPFAWVMGNRVLKEVDASGGTLGGRSTANVGRILGIVWSCLMIAGVLLTLLGVVVFLLTASV